MLPSPPTLVNRISHPSCTTSRTPASLSWTADVRSFIHSGTTPFSWKKSIVHLLESFPFDMRVDLRGGNGGMSEHCLDGAEIGTPFEQMRREGMSQHVRGNGFRDARTPHASTQQFPKRLPRHGGPAGRHEEKPRDPLLQQARTHLIEVVSYRASRLVVHRDETLFRPFPGDEYIAHVKIDLCDFHHDEFRHPQPRRIEQLHHRSIALVLTRSLDRQIQQRFHFSLRQDSRQFDAATPGREPDRGILVNHPLLPEKPEPPTNGGQAAG